jgi:orotidine-5'-phosphate decarboxylase
MEAPSWIELVERNVARFGDLVAGIDPSPADIPEFFGHDGAWIGRFVDFVIESIDGRQIPVGLF